MKEDNIIQQKSYAFAVRVVKMYKFLVESKNERVLSKQVLRSGTSIGANIEEAIGAQSDKDFLARLTVAYKEARETHYWIRLLRDTDFIEPRQADSLLLDVDEIMKIIGSIQRTVKAKSES